MSDPIGLHRAFRDNPHLLRELKAFVEEGVEQWRSKTNKLKDITIQVTRYPDAKKREDQEAIRKWQADRAENAEDAKVVEETIQKLTSEIARKQNGNSKKVRRLERELNSAKETLETLRKEDQELAQKIQEREEAAANHAERTLQRLDPDNKYSGEGSLEEKLDNLRKNLERAEKNTKTLTDRNIALAFDRGWASFLNLAGNPPPQIPLGTSQAKDVALAVSMAWAEQNPEGRANLVEFLKPSTDIEEIKKFIRDNEMTGQSWAELFDFKSQTSAPPPKVDDIEDARKLAEGFKRHRGIENGWVSYFKPESREAALDAVEQWLRENPGMKKLNPMYTGMFGHTNVTSKAEAEKILGEYNEIYKRVFDGEKSPLKPEDLLYTSDEAKAQKRFEDYKKVHPQTSKTWRDFYREENDSDDDGDGDGATKVVVDGPDKDEDFIWNLFF